MTINYETETTFDVPDDKLKQVSYLVQSIKALRQRVEEQEATLKRDKHDLALLEEVDLPSLMDEIGLAEVKTSDGTPVSVKDDLRMSIPKKNKRLCADWLLANGHGSLVSEDVILGFKKGEADKVQHAVELLREAGFGGVRVDESMNTAQVKSLAKELMGDGEDFPLELFGGFQRRVAVVK
jgi:hypothetical protein